MRVERSLRRALCVLCAALSAQCAVALPETLLVVRIRHPRADETSKYRFEVNLARLDAGATSIATESFAPIAMTTEMCVAVRLRNAPVIPTQLRVRVRAGAELDAQLRYAVVQTRDVAISRGEHKQVVFSTQGQCSPALERLGVSTLPAQSDPARPAAVQSLVASLQATACFEITPSRCRAATPTCECRIDGHTVCLRDDQSCEIAPEATAGFRCIAPAQVDSAAATSNVELPVIDATQCFTMTM